MSRRKPLADTPGLADLESATNPADAPGIMPPPGVEARIRTTVDYNRIVDPEGTNYPDDLRTLAGEEIDNEELPEPVPVSDPVSAFLYTWQRFAGYPLKIVRLPDPATRLIPGQTYNRVCRELEMLSDTPFAPGNLTNDLQIINGNSGGVFRIWLTDENGTPIPGARLERLVVADPPKHRNSDPRHFNPYGYNSFGEDSDPRYYRREREPQPAPLPQKSDMELHIEQMQRNLFEKVMLRALDPPTPPAPDPLAGMNEDDRLALGLLKQGDLLSTVVGRLANLASAPDRVESATWKDKLAEAGVNLVTQNPQIVTTVTDIISRATVAITQGLANAFANRGAQQQFINAPIPPAQPVQHAPAQRAAAPLHAAPYSGGRIEPEQFDGLPETDQPRDHELDDDDEIEMIEAITQLLLSSKPLTMDDPVIIELQETYPEKFIAALAGIAATPSMILIQILCSKSDFCADLFNDPRNGPYLRTRLEELKALIKSSNILSPEARAALADADNIQTQTSSTPDPQAV